MRAVRAMAVAALVAMPLLSSCDGNWYVAGGDAGFPRIQYRDSLISLNDRCPIRQNKLNRAIEPVYVNGRPVGFC